jgi:hypothetical protein
MMPPFAMFPGWPPMGMPQQQFQQPGQQQMPTTDPTPTATTPTFTTTQPHTTANSIPNQVCYVYFVWLTTLRLKTTTNRARLPFLSPKQSPSELPDVE